MFSCNKSWKRDGINMTQEFQSEAIMFFGGFQTQLNKLGNDPSNLLGDSVFRWGYRMISVIKIQWLLCLMGITINFKRNTSGNITILKIQLFCPNIVIATYSGSLPHRLFQAGFEVGHILDVHGTWCLPRWNHLLDLLQKFSLCAGITWEIENSPQHAVGCLKQENRDLHERLLLRSPAVRLSCFISDVLLTLYMPCLMCFIQLSYV